MGDPKTGLTNALRAVLNNADDSLTCREIYDQLAGGDIPCGNLPAILRQRTLAGELIQTEIRGLLAYTLNPEFSAQQARGRGRPPSASPKPGTLARADRRAKAQRPAAAPVAAVHDVAAVAPKAEPSPTATPVEFQRRPAPEIDASLQVEQNPVEIVAAVPAIASIPVAAIDVYAGLEALADVRELIEHLDDAARCVATPTPTRAPLDLRDRVEAIASDIEDAIGDACDARLAHELIKALTVANGATQRALRQLAA